MLFYFLGRGSTCKKNRILMLVGLLAIVSEGHLGIPGAV